jgi:hypothetical protein
MGNSGRRNIPLTAADPDFRMSKEIENGIIEYIKDGYLAMVLFQDFLSSKKCCRTF